MTSCVHCMTLFSIHQMSCAGDQISTIKVECRFPVAKKSHAGDGCIDTLNIYYFRCDRINFIGVSVRSPMVNMVNLNGQGWPIRGRNAGRQSVGPKNRPVQTSSLVFLSNKGANLVIKQHKTASNIAPYGRKCLHIPAL